MLSMTADNGSKFFLGKNKMQRNFPKVLHLHTLSFLSEKNVKITKQVNKKYNQFASENLLWQELLKRDFFINNKKEKKAEEQYSYFSQELLKEKTSFISCVIPYLYSLEIKKENLAGNIPVHGFTHIQEENKPIIIQTEFDHRDHNLNKAYLESKAEFNNAFKVIKGEYPQIDYIKIVRLAENFYSNFILKEKSSIFGDETISCQDTLTTIFESLCKCDAAVAFRICYHLFRQSHLPYGLVIHLLYIACKFSSFETVKEFISKNIELNQLSLDKGLYGSYCIGTPLAAAVFSEAENTNSEKLVQLLLENGADPDAFIEIYDDGNTTSLTIRELCKLYKTPLYRADHEIQQIPNNRLDFVIQYSSHEIKQDSLKRKSPI